MTIQADVRGKAQLTEAVSLSTAQPLLVQYAQTIRQYFPKLRSLTSKDQVTYEWDLEKLGPPTYKLPVKFATQIHLSSDGKTLTLTPIKGIGNAQIQGRLELTGDATQIKIDLSISGTVEVPLPRLMKGVVAPIVGQEFKRLVDEFAENLRRAVLV